MMSCVQISAKGAKKRMALSVLQSAEISPQSTDFRGFDKSFPYSAWRAWRPWRLGDLGAFFGSKPPGNVYKDEAGKPALGRNGDHT
jgi:hypothetical protein